MRKTSVGLVVVAVLALGAGAAFAQPDDDWQRECFGPGPISMEEAQQGCVKVEGGEWEPAGGRRGGDLSGPESMFGTFIFFGILLGLVPAFAGAGVASSANLSAGAGFGIGLFGSWLGVIGLYLFGQSQKRSVPVTGPGPSVESETAAADRLRTLKDLLDQGLITQEEYQARRRAAVDSL